MSELHLILVREIGGEPTEADLELDCNQLDNLSGPEQGVALYEAYQTCRNALRNTEAEKACDHIKNIIPMPKQDIPIQ